jgi:hypothetical protein
METGRASYFFPIVFFFIFFYLIIHRLKLQSFNDKATIFSLLVFGFFFVSIFWFTIRYNTDRNWFGKELDSFVPVKEVAFLKTYKLEGPIFNDYAIGGYLLLELYPYYKVFIDPRLILYRTQVFPDYMEFTTKHLTSEDIERFREKYPFKIAILHYSQMSLIFDFLKADGDEWRLLYFEKNAAILIHKSLISVISSKLHKEITDPEVLINVLNNPSRFKDVRNPGVLLNVFNIYINLDPKAGHCIYDIFKKNVSDFFKLKPEILKAMDFEIKLKKKEIENKAKWLSS